MGENSSGRALCRKTIAVLLVSSIIFWEYVDGESLLQVNIYFRHGDRTPHKSFKTDPNKDKWAEIGYDQLLRKGKDRAYRFGKWLRQRYDKILPGFLGTSYD